MSLRWLDVISGNEQTKACLCVRVTHICSGSRHCVCCRENLLFNYPQRKHWNIITLCFTVFLHDWVCWHFSSSAPLPLWWIGQVRWRPLLLLLLLLLPECLPGWMGMDVKLEYWMGAESDAGILLIRKNKTGLWIKLENSVGGRL